MNSDRRRSIRRAVLAAGLVATVLTVACWPTSRFVGVNFVVSRQTLPLWVKTVDFVDRDLNMKQLAQDVLAGVDDDEARAATAMGWTRAHIRPRPSELPVVDDHIWHIVVRGYGQSDQQADVFTALLAYAGVPAYWGLVGTAPNEIPLSYVWIREQWRVYDATRGVAFRTPLGELATPEQLAGDLNVIRTAASPVVPEIDAYLAHFAGYQPPSAPDVLRADMQMPGRRLWFEARRLLGMEVRAWQMRPHPATVRPQEHQRP